MCLDTSEYSYVQIYIGEWLSPSILMLHAEMYDLRSVS